jgi:hypothetical protein
MPKLTGPQAVFWAEVIASLSEMADAVAQFRRP